MQTKVNLTSLDLNDKKIEELNRLFPEVFSENRIVWEKLKQVLGEQIDKGTEKFGFMWVGKTSAINSVLIPSKLTLKPNREESVKFEENENLIIEGDNFEALKLLQKAYFQKIKMIYIDPPYNTGGDFVYRDNYKDPLSSYLEQTNQNDGNGMSLTTNKETNGRFHSSWLNMMYPRLKLAWNLLNEEGVIFISIDDNEMHRVRMVMDEIFGEENFIEQIVWKRRANTPNDRYIGKIHEYVLVYSRNKEKCKLYLQARNSEIDEKYKNPNNDSRGRWFADNLSANGKGGRLTQSCIFPIINPKDGKAHMPPKNKCWLYNQEKVQAMLKEDRIGFRESSGAPYLKRFLNEVRAGATLSTIISDGGYSVDSAKTIKDIFKSDVFEFSKPVSLIKKLLQTGLGNNDLILDFFAGSGTTAQAVLELNKEDKGSRQFILIQMPEPTQKNSEAYKAGFKTIADICKERVRRVIKGYGDNPEPLQDGFKVFKLDKSNYVENNFEYNPEHSEEDNKQAFQQYLNQAKQSSLFDAFNPLDIVYENIVKEGLSLNSKVIKTSIDGNKVYKTEDSENKLNFLICLDKTITKDTVKLLLTPEYKNKLFIGLDTAFTDSDKANLGLHLTLKTI